MTKNTEPMIRITDYNPNLDTVLDGDSYLDNSRSILPMINNKSSKMLLFIKFRIFLNEIKTIHTFTI